MQTKLFNTGKAVKWCLLIVGGIYIVIYVEKKENIIYCKEDAWMKMILLLKWNETVLYEQKYNFYLFLSF